jgi:hypothetical protein
VVLFAVANNTQTAQNNNFNIYGYFDWSLNMDITTGGAPNYIPIPVKTAIGDNITNKGQVTTMGPFSMGELQASPTFYSLANQLWPVP